MYCTVADLIARFSELEIAQLTDVEDRESVITSVAEQAIRDASGEADSYLAGRYALPIAGAVPDILAAKVADMARYRLYDDHPTETVRKRYEDAVTWLKLVATGTVRLSLAAPATESLAGGMAYSAPTAAFTELVW